MISVHNCNPYPYLGHSWYVDLSSYPTHPSPEATIAPSFVSALVDGCGYQKFSFYTQSYPSIVLCSFHITFAPHPTTTHYTPYNNQLTHSSVLY